MVKLTLTVFLAVLGAAAINAVAACVFSAALGEFASAARLPVLNWWQSFCLLVCLGIVGGASGMSRAVASAKPRS